MRVASQGCVRSFVCLAATSLTIAASCSAPLAKPEHVDAAEGYSLSFPGAVATRSGREGPVVFRIDSARTPDGARFEAAWFGFPEPLDEADRGALLQRVELGLAAAPGTKVVSREPSPPVSGEGIDLVLDRPDERRGFHRILYPGPDAMLQVSAVGPRGGEWEREVPRFWESVTLSRQSPAR